jgi:hypothetical protein
MSGPYDSYGGQQGYGSQYPAQGYNQQSQYPSQGYNQQPQYGQPQQYPTYDQNSSFGPPRRADSFGPPVAGGFIDGQQGVAYGQYDASNPQGHQNYYGQQQPQQYGQQQPQQYGSNDAYAQNQAYQSGMGTQSQGADHEFARQSTDANAPNYDPNAPPMTETDRGLLGAIGGGVAGHFGGKKVGHGFLGTIGGAIIGSMTEDYAKKQKKKHHHSGQSSWGGGGRY